MLNSPLSKQGLNHPSTSRNNLHILPIKASDRLGHFLITFKRMHNLRLDGQQTSGNHSWAQVKLNPVGRNSCDQKRR
jgi:hypothetical protein